MDDFRFPNEPEAYRAARDELLDAEVALRDHGEAVAAKRRTLPLGGRLGDDYVLEQVVDGATRDVKFADLFGGHSTLMIYTMMFGRAWDAPCPSCTSIVDAIDANWRVVERQCAVAVAAGASAEQLATWGAGRGWTVPLVSGGESSYVLDYAGFATEDAGLVSVMNVFRRTDEGIFHWWSSELIRRPMESGHPRHVDAIWPMWNLLDMTPDGRGTGSIPKQDFRHEYFTENVFREEDD